MARYTIGKRNGVAVVAEYAHAHGSLPVLTIKEKGKPNRDFRGSSLGSANPDCSPNAEDLRYWQSLAGLQSDETAIARTLAAHKGITARREAAWAAHGDEKVACPRCDKLISRRELDAIGQCCDCDEKEVAAGR